MAKKRAAKKTVANKVVAETEAPKVLVAEEVTPDADAPAEVTETTPEETENTTADTNAPEEDESTDAPEEDAPSEQPEEAPRRFRGEVIVSVDNRIMNGRVYKDIRTVEATYLETEEAYEAGLNTTK